MERGPGAGGHLTGRALSLNGGCRITDDKAIQNHIVPLFHMVEWGGDISAVCSATTWLETLDIASR